MHAESNNVLAKAFEFAVRVVRLYQYLVKEHKEFVLSKPLLNQSEELIKILTSIVKTSQAN